MFKKIAALSVLVSLLLGACAQSGNKQLEANLSQGAVKNVAVVSSFGPMMHHIFIGFTVFGNSSQDVNVPELALDAYASNYAVQKLKARGYNAVALNYNATTYALSQTDYAQLMAQAKAAGYDTLIVLDASGGMANSPPIMQSGYGTAGNGGLGMYHHKVYSSFMLRAYDIASGANSAYSDGYSAWSGSAATPIEIDWQNDFAQLSQADKEKIFTTLKQNIAGKIDYALNDIKL